MGGKSLHLQHRIPHTCAVLTRNQHSSSMCVFSQYLDLYIISVVLYSFTVFVVGDNICQIPSFTILVHCFSVPLSSLSFSF